MKNGAVPTIAFYVAVAVCLWPLYLSASQVVQYVQMASASHALVRIPPAAVLAHAAQTVLLLWAIPAAVMLFRKGQDSYAWLVVALVLAPTLSALALR